MVVFHSGCSDAELLARLQYMLGLVTLKSSMND